MCKISAQVYLIVDGLDECGDEVESTDVQLYVATELEQRIGKKKLRLRGMALKDEILVKLVEGAKWMFRWVACQLDHLCGLPHDRARRKALNKLPPTLPATYERILLKMNNDYDEETKQLVQRTLLLVFRGFPAERLSVRELCQAISISEDSDTLDDDEIVEEQDILRWCGSLL
ncbi:Helo-like-N domain-containing protein [Fusarium sp. Ph1]|nr:Helo-like-N domain-containing protein [Fusarium sp. Ph1]